ncbi:phosphodiester glycosidase family protein [Streptomyces sp. NPDC059582]|uniref:phosphodiester glycosidase family protein n=1 Tax=Streptomyces sp. NPDC059582 TaxID=3346875 RepID=UPI0036ABBE17
MRRHGTVATGVAALALVLTGTSTPAVSFASAAGNPSWLPQQLDSWSTITQHTMTEPVTVTNGVTYSGGAVDSIDGRVPINVVSADTRDANVRLGVVVSHDAVVDPQDETTSSMAVRTGAVAGINGGYFQINASGQANDGEIVGGEIWKSPTSNHEGTISVLRNGSVAYGNQVFSGSVAVDGGASRPLSSVNRLADATGDGITQITPRLGDVAKTWFGGTKVVALGTSDDKGATIRITSVTTGDSLSGRQYGLVGGDAASASGQWIQQNVKVGSVVTTTHRISPDNDIQEMIQGPGRILKDGAVFQDPVNQMPSGLHPESVIGSTADGHLVMATLDGQKAAGVALGVGWQQVASYMRSLGVRDAVLLDGGGSTAMAVRSPGDTQATLANTPSDLSERPVANGLFVYSTSMTAGPAKKAFINDGAALSTAEGVVSKVKAFATDRAGNPTSDPVFVTAEPSSLGTWTNGVFKAGSAGSGKLTVRAGRKTAHVKLTVAAAFDQLSISPAQQGLANNASQKFTAQGTNGKSAAVTVAPESVTWTLDRSDLGRIDPATGVFTAASTGSGEVRLTAAAGGRTATATLSIGSVIKPLLTADNAAEWQMRADGGAVTVPADHFAETTDVPPGSGQARALQVEYSFPNDTKQHRVRVVPNNGAGAKADKNELGQVPQSLRFQFKVESAAPQKSWMVLNVSDPEGHLMGLWLELAPSDYNRWNERSAKLVWGVFTSYPLTIQDISLVGQNATGANVGKLTFAGMKLQYSVGTPAQETPYQAINPNNPSWLQYTQDPADFRPGGQTFIIGDDGHLVAANPDSTSVKNIAGMVDRTTGKPFRTASGQTVAPLPVQARPDVALSLGDIADTGTKDDLSYAKAQWERFGLPLYDVVGNHEVSQGTIPQNTNFSDVFQQNTHFSFKQGQATFIGLDNSSGSIAVSDKFQKPAEPQYPWLAQQLEKATTPVVFVGVHMPAYDHAPNKSNQFSNRWEAQQYLQLIQDYRLSHPHQRVVLMYGHSRGFADQLIDPLGNEADAKLGIPQFTIADIGTRPYVAADKGGLFHFALFHVNQDGTVQYSVQAMLKSMTIDQGTAGSDAAAPRTDTLVAGQAKQYTATAVNANGNDINEPPTMPVADPMSHVWASSNKKVAKIDPVTGALTALKPGTTTISVTTGGITSKLNLLVSKADQG